MVHSAYIVRVDSMTTTELVEWINELIEAGKLWKFYKSKQWRTLSAEVLKEQHNECQVCKEQGRYTKADTVHHIQYVRKHPETALSKTYTYKGKEYRNLIAICKACHNKVHSEKGFNKQHSAKLLNEERW